MVADPAMPPDWPARVLVTYASRMGSTAEIGEAIGERLKAAGLEVTVVPVGQAPSRRASTRSFAAARSTRLAGTKPRPPSGNIVRRWRSGRPGCSRAGHAATPPGNATRRPRRCCASRRTSESTPPQVFGGNLDPARAKTRIARWVANSDLAGDYPNWDQIRAWADKIARQVAEQVHTESKRGPSGEPVPPA